MAVGRSVLLAGTSQGGNTPFNITIPTELPQGPLSEVVTNIIKYALGAAGGLAVLFLVVGGIYYIIAQGDPERVEKAKKTIKYAITGIVFILLSLVIVLTIQAAIKP